MEIKLIAATTIDWKTYIDFIQSTTSISPTRCLDKYEITLDSPIAFIMSLQNINSAKIQYLSKIIDSYFKHYQISFLLKGDYETVVQIIQSTGLPTTILYKKKDICIAIISGSIYDWHYTIITGCSKENTHIKRKIFNDFFFILNSSELYRLWNNVSRVKQIDGTIALEVK